MSRQADRRPGNRNDLGTAGGDSQPVDVRIRSGAGLPGGGELKRVVAATNARRALRWLAVAASSLAGAGLILAAGDPVTVLFHLPYAGIGALLAVRRPAILVGWLLMALGWGGLFAWLRVSGDRAALAAGTAALPDAFVAWAAWVGWPVAALALLALLLDLPGGHLRGGRRRAHAALLSLSTVALLLMAFAPRISPPHVDGTLGAVPNPFAVLPDAAFWAVVPDKRALDAVQIASAAAALGLLVVRYRRASGLERLQLRWILSAMALHTAAVATLIATLTAIGVPLGTDFRISGALVIAVVPPAVGWFAIPSAIGVAVLRYRLYEIDRIVSRTIGWAILTAALATVFATLVLGLQAVLASWTGGSTLAVALSTLTVAALFQPARSRIQAAVDRRFHRRHQAAMGTADAFAQQLRDELELSALAGSLRSSAVASVEPSLVGLWIRESVPHGGRGPHDPR